MTLPLFPPPPASSQPPTTALARPGRIILLPGVAHEFYQPSAVDEQWQEWGANCGPSAIAALVGREVKDVRAVVERLANGDKNKRCGRSGWWLGHMHAGHLSDTLCELGLEPRRTNFKPGEGRWPKKGLAMIQTEGPWCHPPSKSTARFRYTHTIAVVDAGPAIGITVYDGNVEAWVKEKWWAEKVMKGLVEGEKRATGWHVMMTLEVVQ